MSKDKVIVTKKIANAWIHVERAIGRMKVFSILRKTLPIALVPLIDDILVGCAGISNLLPPLVQETFLVLPILVILIILTLCS